MATECKIVVVLETGGTQPCIECPHCLGVHVQLPLQVRIQYHNRVRGHVIYCKLCIDAECFVWIMITAVLVTIYGIKLKSSD